MQELLKEHFTKPFFFLQIICSAVFLFDDLFWSACISLGTITAMEFFSVQSRLNQEKDLDQFKPKVSKVTVVRHNKQVEVNSDELIQGDVVLLKKDNSAAEVVVPADLVIIEGKAIVDESLLTGESIPISKDNIKSIDNNVTIDAELNNIRNIVLFSGTKLIETSNPNSSQRKDNSIKCYVLRTGRFTSQGQLIANIIS